MKTLIVSGGSSDERKISLLSAKNVAKCLKKSGHKITLFDLRRGLIELEKEVKKHHVVFPVLHGKEGEGGDLQEFLESIGAKFVGSGSKANRNGWDKINFKKFCDSHGIKTPKWIVTSSKDFSFPLPFVIKPSDSGSSVDTYLVKNEKDLKKVELDKLIKKYGKLIIEELIEGKEVTQAILGDKTLPTVEIIPPQGEFFDYKNKYNGRTQEIPHAPSVSKEIQDEVKKLALEIHQKLDLKHISRTDFMLKGHNIYALEVNTIPGLTTESLFPKAVRAEGLKLEEAFDHLLKMAIE